MFISGKPLQSLESTLIPIKRIQAINKALNPPEYIAKAITEPHNVKEKREFQLPSNGPINSKDFTQHILKKTKRNTKTNQPTGNNLQSYNRKKP